MTQSSDAPPSSAPREHDEPTPSSASGPVHYTREQLMAMHPRDLVKILEDRHIKHTAVVEKPELVQIILDKCTH